MIINILLQEVKYLGNITINTDDHIIQHYIDILTEEGLKYTNRIKLTLGISNLIVSYALKMYLGEAYDSVQHATSVKRGDTQVSFTANSGELQGELLQSYRKALKSMKIMRAVTT